MTDKWRRVADIAEIPEGTMRSCELEGRDIVICHSHAGWYALDNTCTHALARLSEGRLRGCRLICPLHGASFDIRDGHVLGAPATNPLSVHQLRIVDEQVEVALGNR